MSELHSHVHYRSSFLLQPNSPQGSWSELIKDIRYWVSESRNAPLIDRRHLCRSWFYTGGNTQGGKARVETIREVGDGTTELPQFWSLRFEHPDSQKSARIWRTDIGVTSEADGYLRFSLALSHRLRPDYIGEQPEEPPISRPWLITYLIDKPYWQAYAGSQPLASEVQSLTEENADSFWQQLKHQDRTCPIVLLMPMRDSGEIKLDAQRLANDLAGIAPVFVGDSQVYRRLNDLMPEDYRCYAGYVRIYVPQLNPSFARDHLRHRYFGHTKIDDLTPERIHEIIVSSLGRSERIQHRNVVTSIEDITARRRQSRLEELRAKGESNIEWTKLLEEDNSTLNDELERARSQIQEDEALINTQIEELEMLNAQVVAQESRLRYQQAQFDTLYREIEELKSVQMAVQELRTLPNSLEEALTLVARLKPDRIAVTERALQSSQSSDFTDINVAWVCLWQIATTLHDLYFDPQHRGIDIEREFKSRSGYDLAINEGAMTSRDRSLMALRTDTYKGKDIDITPHVKYGNKRPKLLRVHYAICRDEEKIIIGHCGDHLENRSTRNQR